jgi:hypothetical protein
MKSAPQLLSAFALTGWGTLTTPYDGGALRATIDDATLVLSNPGSREAFYRAIDEEAAARANQLPCVDSPGFGSVPTHSNTRVELDSVLGYEPGRSRAVRIYWWHEHADHTGATAARIRVLHVTL